ncbi:MAG: hypothetical protein WBP82_02860 [Leuconostoc mesenteroides]
MSEKQEPKLVFDERLARIFVVTKYMYGLLSKTKLHALEKYDVTEQLNEVLDKVYDKAYDHASKGIKLKDRRKIICLVGSARFEEEFQQAFADFSALNFIVLLPSCHLLEKTPGGKLIKDKDKFNDELQKAKIDMSDAIYVVNKDDYIGESTRQNINYAEKQSKTVFYLVENIEIEKVM